MKIAVTADLHLTSRQDHPERFHALEELLAQLRRDQIPVLVLAGDLYDRARDNYSEFESLCARPENQGISFYIIPGNHDAGLSPSAITAPNARVITEPELVALDPDAAAFLLIPYRDGQTMGEGIAPFRDRLAPDRWVLLGHGDWTGGLRDPNPYEPGVYMPLTNRDLELFRPRRAILGHIHCPSDAAPVHYPGSPCGLDITETGRRRFLVYDTRSGEVEARPVKTDHIFFNEHLVVVPMEDEAAAIRRAVARRIDAWQLAPDERARVRLRVRVRGYSSDRRALKRALAEAFAGLAFHKDEEPDIAGVSLSNDLERQYIADRVRERLEELEWPAGPDEPDRDRILLDALQLIYGG